MSIFLSSPSAVLIKIAYRILQDRKVRLNEWDGKALKEVAVLEGNQGAVSALAFSPDGKYLASGDVSLLLSISGLVPDQFCSLPPVVRQTHPF